jgi:hypothetical protein
MKSNASLDNAYMLLSRSKVKGIMTSANGETCQIRLPGCSYDPSTTVFAHCSQKSLIEGGFGFKGFPIGSYADHFCHGVVDGRIKTDLEKDFVRQAELEGVVRTFVLLIKKGLWA